MLVGGLNISFSASLPRHLPTCKTLILDLAPRWYFTSFLLLDSTSLVTLFPKFVTPSYQSNFFFLCSKLIPLSPISSFSSAFPC